MDGNEREALALMIPIVSIVGGLGIAFIAILGSFVTTIVKRNAVEKSRRELAAYVAEGSMTPDEAERLMRVDPNKLSSKDSA